MPRGLMLLRTSCASAPRFGIAHHFEQSGIVLRAAYGIFYTPVDMNTWCNELQQMCRFVPDHPTEVTTFTPQITRVNFPQPVLGQTTVSFSPSIRTHRPQ